MNEQIRAEFEKYYCQTEGVPFKEIQAGRIAESYRSPHMDRAWGLWQAAHARYAGSGEADLLEYVLQDDIHNRLTPRVIDIAYTAFMLGKQPNSEDGGASDWFTDTKPAVMKAISQLRSELLPTRTPAQPKVWLNDGQITLPTTEEEAVAMAIVGMRYLQDNHPERLKAVTAQPKVPDRYVQVRIDDLRKALSVAQIPPWSSNYKDHPEALKRLAQEAQDALSAQENNK